MEANDQKQQEDIKATRTPSAKLRDFIPIYMPGVDKGLINHSTPRKRRFLDFLKAQPSKDYFLKFASLRRNLTRRLQTAPDAALSTSSSRRHFRVPFIRKINWQSLIQYFKNWIKHPMNMALSVWLVFVAVGIVILGLLMLGALNQAIPSSSQRKRWTEIVNQILNALFTIMCLYQHPKIGHHLVILCRWNQKDVVELRGLYCKTSAKRSHERAHMAFVIILLHLTCLSQYILCALYWGWNSKNRPDWATYTVMGLGIGAPIIAGLHTVYGPLGKKIPEPEIDLISNQEMQKQSSENSTTSKVRVVVTDPVWLGGVFDCWDDVTVAYLSFFCTFCVFGWNMERLGFGNMYVHIITFVLLCIAPLLVFSVTALNISDDTLRYTVGITGFILCFCGLLYGGFWRMQMRKKFRLPGNPFCCGYNAMTDFMSWLFCWACSLSQEVRTGNFYEIEDDSFYRRNLEEEARRKLEPLPREAGAGFRVRLSFEEGSKDEFVAVSIDDLPMSAPLPPSIQTEECQKQPSC